MLPSIFIMSVFCAVIVCHDKKSELHLYALYIDLKNQSNFYKLCHYCIRKKIHELLIHVYKGTVHLSLLLYTTNMIDYFWDEKWCSKIKRKNYCRRMPGEIHHINFIMYLFPTTSHPKIGGTLFLLWLARFTISCQYLKQQHHQVNQPT